MGLLSQAAKTFDLMRDEIGVLKEDTKYFPLVPLYHVKKSIELSVLLKADGTLESVSKITENGIIPATEEAQGRSGTTVAPFPLIDQVKYFIQDEKREVYLNNLKRWCDFDPNNVSLQAIYYYVSNKSLSDDLEKAGISSKDSLEKNVGWIVESNGYNIKTWDNKKLVESYTSFFKKENNWKKKEFCMISGKETLPIKIIPPISKFGLAKLISSNDKSDYSYRGRFIDSEEALSVGYDTTQKAINALSWLCGNQSVSIGRGYLLCWNPNGIEVQNPTLPLFNNNTERKVTYSDYKKALEDYVLAKTSRLLIDKQDVITVIFDIATTGRLSTKFYSELSLDDFLTNLASFDKECCWYSCRDGEVKSPSLSQIVKFAFGAGENFRVDGKISNAYYPILIERRVCNGRIPTEIFRKLVNKCSNLQIYMKDGFRLSDELLFVTCAVMRKCMIDINQKEYAMALEKDLQDRSYQYGRLLAVFDKIEQDALSTTESKRTSNAVRMQSMFIRRPGNTSRILLEKLKTGYYPRFSGVKEGLLAFYEKLIGEIMENISSFSLADFDKPLDETYILGYYLQKNEFYKKKNTDSEES